MNKDRYTISYREKDGKWKEVGAKSIKEANQMYDMIGEEATFKVLVDNLTDEQLKQDG